jgi:hypothetical protein
VVPIRNVRSAHVVPIPNAEVRRGVGVRVECLGFRVEGSNPKGSQKR